jgi:putative flippase GtrA
VKYFIVRLSFAPRWLRFALVGGVGFVVDGSVLSLGVLYWGLDPVVARLFSFASAILTTWFLNRFFTFSSSVGGFWGRRLFFYVLVGCLGFLVNFFIYWVIIFFIPFVSRFPLLALIPSSVGAAVFNYFGASLVFASARDQKFSKILDSDVSVKK